MGSSFLITSKLSRLPLYSFPSEEVIAIELAVEFTIEQSHFLGRLEANTFHGSIIGRYDPRLRACELMLESSTNRAV